MPTQSVSAATLMASNGRSLKSSTGSSSATGDSFVSTDFGLLDSEKKSPDSSQSPGPQRQIKTDTDVYEESFTNNGTPHFWPQSSTLKPASYNDDSRLTEPMIRVYSTRIGLKPQLKSISNIVQNDRSSSVTTNNRMVSSQSRSAASDTNDLQTTASILPITKSPKVYFKDPNISQALTNGYATKPLVINHTSSYDKIANQSEISIIPTLSSQSIFSSIIATRAKSPSSARISRTTTTTTTQRHLSTAKTPTFVLKSSCGSSSSCGKSSDRSAVDPSFSDTKSTTITTMSKQSTTSGNHSSSATSTGHAVSARLMDLGKSLLDAARAGHVEQVRQLVIDSGAPFTSDWLGTTALHLASHFGHTEIAEILLRGGVNRDARTKLERTALHLAAQGGHVEVVDLLLIHGSDVNARDMLKMTPLHWAVERGHTCVVEKLLFSGADVTVRSKFQLTPIDIAQNSNSYEVIKLFKSWTNKNENSSTYSDLNNNFSKSHDMLDVDYHLALGDNPTTSRGPLLDIDEPCIDLVELEWNTLKFEPDFFLTNDEENEPKVEYLMKIVEELQKENRQLRQRVEQLSTTSQ